MKLNDSYDRVGRNKCSKCSLRAAVFFRKYSGEKLCKDCFSNSILHKTSKTITKYNMIKRNNNVAVAVSGGKDSLVLLHILNEISQKLDFNIKAITIDEGIKGYREEALKIAREFCKQLDIEHHIYSYKELFKLTLDDALDLRKSKMSSCSICGTLRRRALDIAAKDINYDIIATAHNLDDQIQTFIINMISGNINKIGFMYPDSTTKIKPFSEIYESEIVFFAYINKIPFQSEPCPHMNEGIRTQIREFVNVLEKEHSGIKNNLLQSILKLANRTKQLSDQEKKICKTCKNLCSNDICSVCNMISRITKT